MGTRVLGTLAAFVLLATSGFGQTSKPPATQTPAQQFAHAKELIDNNCIDCEGGTRDGMEQGIKEMKQAIAGGYQDKVSAYKLLDDAYASMDTYTEKDRKENAANKNERAQSMSELLKLAPNDPEVLETYADSVNDNAEKAKILKRVVELDPKRSDAVYGLGLITAQTDVAQGMRLVEQAMTQQKDAEAVVTYVQGLMGIMEAHGCALPDATKWQDKMSTAYDKSTRGEGDPAAMPEFKTQFLSAVRQQRCANAVPK